MFVANGGPSTTLGTVSVISDSTNTVVANITVGTTPEGLAYDSHTGQIFVANTNDGTVSIISDITNTVVNMVTVGNGPFGVAYDSGKDEIFVTNAADSTVSVLSDHSASSASPSPTIPEFSSAMLASVAAAILVVTFAVVAVRRNKAKKNRR